MKKWLLLFSVSLLSGMMAFAVGTDDRGIPNDPAVNDRANACYEGGSMAQKCESDSAWECGWYVIRWELDASFGRPAFCGPSNEPADPIACALVGGNLMVCANQSAGTGDLNNDGTFDQLFHFVHQSSLQACPHIAGYAAPVLYAISHYTPVQFDLAPFYVAAPYLCVQHAL